MSIEHLVSKYQAERNYYLSNAYNETLLRSDFLDPFFELLGWDIKNSAGRPTNEREVILEEALKANASEHSKKPDYTFRLFSERKYFVEAKKPFVAIQKNDETAKQIRRYGFTAKLKISVLSNFEYLIIYDTSKKVETNDTFQKAIIKKYHYTEYKDKFEEINTLLGKKPVYNGLFEKEWEHIEDKLNHYSIDNLFLTQINEWRNKLAAEIYKSDVTINEQQLNDVVQSYLNRILFLRVCEDRNIEQYQALLKLVTKSDFRELIKKFNHADKKYNSGLFDQLLSNTLIEDVSSVFWEIIKQLYYPENPYSFSVFSSDILGRIYETFLSEKIIIKNGGTSLAKVPEHTDRDVVTTPTYIITEILKHTVLVKCAGKTDTEILNLKFADIACGSGAFLIELYQFLIDTFIDYYIVYNPSTLIRTNLNTYKLSFEKKYEILIKCIFGIDKDYNAAEATKFGLLLKLLEDEDINSIKHKSPILPSLMNNIFYGNSLIKPTQIQVREEANVINPFDFSALTFDVIIGNPPYMKSEDMKNITPLEFPIYKKNFTSAYKQFDKYFLFIEKGLALLNKNGILGFIVPSKFTRVGAGLKLREILSNGEHLKYLVSFEANQIFEDKTTYTSILILSKTRVNKFSYAGVKDFDKWKIRDFSTIIIDEIETSKLSNELWFLIPPYLKNVYNKIIAQSQTLENIVGKRNINNGIQTSANDVFVIKPISEANGLVSFNHNGNIYQVEKEILKPYYETNRKKGDEKLYTYRTLKPNSYVIYPYENSNGKLKLIDINKLKNNFPYVYKYFIDNQERLKKRDIKPIPSSNQEWYRYGRSQYLDLGDISEKIFIGVMSSGEKYPIDYSKTLHTAGGTAGYCSIYLSNDSPYSIYYIQAILNSKYVEWIVLLRGEIFRGGFIARGTKVLKDIPIRKINFFNPYEKDLHDKIVDVQKDLIDLQSQIDSSANEKRVVTILQRQFDIQKNNMDGFLAKLYNLRENDLLVPQVKELYEIN